MERVTAAVVTFNGADLIPDLSGTLQAIPEMNCVVYDSGSEDDTLDLLQKLLPQAEIISGPNLGFGRGCNRCLEKVETEYTLLLNSDASISAEALGELVDYLDGNPEYAAVQPLVRLWGWEQVTASRGVFLTEYGEAWDSGFFHLEPFVSPSALQVPAITAAVALWKTDVLRSLRGFDERFFMYFEDADLSLRAGAAGWKLATVMKAHALHRVGRSSSRSDAGMWELASAMLISKRFLGGGSLGLKWWKREFRILLSLILRGKSPFPRLKTLLSASRTDVDSIELPEAVKSMLFGTPMDMPLPRPEEGACGPGWQDGMAAPWAGAVVTGETALFTLESTGHAVTGAIINGDDKLLVRFIVPAGGYREYKLAPGTEVVYIKCDSPEDKLKVGIV